MMFLLNRNLAVIKPKEKFLQWIQSVDNPRKNDVTLKELRSDCTTLLVPEFMTNEEARKYVESLYDELFEMELAAWYLDKTLWPEPRTRKMFKQWFDIEIHSMVLDVLADDPEKEEFDSEI